MNNSISTSEASVKQQCALPHLYFAIVMFGIIYAGGMGYFGYTRNWPLLVAWLVLLPCLRWASLRASPFTSKLRGQGPIDDKLPGTVNKTHAEVTLYTHNGCPFCPIVKKRLEALQKEMDFTLTHVDLSFTPQVAASRGIRSVPVVEVGNERLFGNATTEQLAQLIGGAQTSEPILGPQVPAAA